jgi:hypothetical protein
VFGGAYELALGAETAEGVGGLGSHEAVVVVGGDIADTFGHRAEIDLSGFGFE